MDVATIFMNAQDAARKAGQKWLDEAEVKYLVKSGDRAVGAMFDLCGNAHVQFSDKRSASFKSFKKAGLIRHTSSGCLELNHGFNGRQEHGLKMACCEAAVKVLKDAGVTDVRIWDYID